MFLRFSFPILLFVVVSFLAGCTTQEDTRMPASAPTEKIELKSTDAGTVALVETADDSYDRVMFLFRRHSAHIQACYESRLKTSPGMIAKVTLLFVVNDKGNVTSAKFKGNVMKDKQLGSCILKVVKDMQFGQLYKGEFYTFEMPLILEPNSKKSK